jgi:hypothetical protein
MNAYRRQKCSGNPVYIKHGKRYKERHPDRVKEQQKKYKRQYTPEEIAAKEAAIALKAAERAAIEERKAKRTEQARLKRKAREEATKARLAQIEANKAKKAQKAKEYQELLKTRAAKKQQKEIAKKKAAEERLAKKAIRDAEKAEYKKKRIEERNRLDNQHGTTVGDYDRCKRKNKTACAPCKAVAAKYVRNKFKTDPKYKEADKRWKKANPRKRAVNNRDRARRNGAKVSYYTREHIFKRDGYDCYLCNRPVDLQANPVQGQPNWELYPHVEHVIPLSKGGDDTLDNVKIAHAICNINKGTRLLSELISS